jgi:hypothetical protein
MMDFPEAGAGNRRISLTPGWNLLPSLKCTPPYQSVIGGRTSNERRGVVNYSPITLRTRSATFLAPSFCIRLAR